MGSAPKIRNPTMESDDQPRAKFLCSFGGSVVPRPLDGLLRYVSGETRIVSLPRDVIFTDLLSRARELFDDTSVIKYQSPDDDLDALVSVINDDDVVNMMEEYDKLLASSNGDGGITRLRIFLFSNYENHFDVDEREISERRYVDALNNVVDADHGEFANSPDAQFEIMGWAGENGGFPCNLGHARNMFDGSPCACEYCRVVFHRSQAQAYMGHFSGSCADCYRNREPSFYKESHGYDHGWGHHHQHHRHQGSHPYIVDGNAMNAPFGHGDFFDEFGNEVFHGHHLPHYGVESPYQVPPNFPPIQNTRRRVQVPIRAGMPYDSQGLMLPNGYDQLQSPRIGQNGNLPQNCYGVNEHSARSNQNVGNGNEGILVVPDVNLEARVEEGTDENLGTNLPELIDSVKNTAIERAEEVKARVEENPEDHGQQAELEAELDGDGDHKDISKIEPTKAEAEAFAQGLQTVRNDDLEEIRELGSGAYGSVYHGKWRGSDVAIKRIKASCFTGKPSERVRLIADFWKEALILSSLHHPNVVAFYGVVRDGPDGNLATVTEFMINGSLKQFLQKKDRTIDRRKRLIIAMDAAFGMEYLHGKNIVHFDLKCENLLVNMRDPQRPICKIGDLGLSKIKQHTLVSGGVRGTLPWMAPELLTGKNIMVTEKVDVYSFGIAMWELLTGEEPYGDMHCGSIIGGIMSNSLRPQIPTWCDPEWRSLMESCWSSDPLERPSFSEISQKLRKMAAPINLK